MVNERLQRHFRRVCALPAVRLGRHKTLAGPVGPARINNSDYTQGFIEFPVLWESSPERRPPRYSAVFWSSGRFFTLSATILVNCITDWLKAAYSTMSR